MGCAYSGRRHKQKTSQTNANNDNNRQRIFSVCNVDDSGQEVNFGKIEITDSDLVLHQKQRNSIFWSLRSLRRYGFDSELFSFECGRRCPTGAGIYAFKCQNAEQLFNCLQEAIQMTSRQESSSHSLPANESSPPEVIPRQLNQQQRQLYANHDLPLQHQYMNSPFYVNTCHVLNREHVYPNDPESGAIPPKSQVNANYAKFDDFLRFYVNVEPQLSQQSNDQSPPAADQSPPPEEPEVTCNYITLDLDQTGSAGQSVVVQTAPATPVQKSPPMEIPALAGSPPLTPTSLVAPMPYAQIDFEKTCALSNSAMNHRKL